MSEYQDWLLTEGDRIATLTLNRPEAMNCFVPSTFHELRDIATRLGANKGLCAVIVQGQGEHFSVGMDTGLIQAMVAEPEWVFRRHLFELQLCFDAFEALEKPTIAKIRGSCLGAGLILALCCDFRIASQHTVFSLPEVKLGVAVVMGTQRLARVVGIAASKEMILLGERFSAPVAQSYGLLYGVVPPDQFDSAVDALAAKFRKLPTRTVGIAKRIIDKGYGQSIRDSQNLEMDAQAGLLGSHDVQEALASYLEKRQPAFTGD